MRLRLLLPIALLAPLSGCTMPAFDACAPAPSEADWNEPGIYALMGDGSVRPKVAISLPASPLGLPFARAEEVGYEAASLMSVAWRVASDDPLRPRVVFDLSSHDGIPGVAAGAGQDVPDAELRAYALAFLANVSTADEATRAAWADAVIDRRAADFRRVPIAELSLEALHDRLASTASPYRSEGGGVALHWNETGWNWGFFVPPREAIVRVGDVTLDLRAQLGDRVEARAGDAWPDENATERARADAAAAMRALGVAEPVLEGFRLRTFPC